MKTIGLLGGLGPQATMDFEARLHRAAQRRITPKANSGYPPLVVYYHRRPPHALSDDGKPRSPLALDPELLEAARWLGVRADFLVITSNYPHLFATELESASGRPVLSMIETALDEVRRRGWSKVGVLGMGEPIVYTRRLSALGLAYEIVGPEAREAIDQRILMVMEGREDESSRVLVRDALSELRGRGVSGIILGCTELPLLLRDEAIAPDLLNPAELLAEAAIARALE